MKTMEQIAKEFNDRIHADVKPIQIIKNNIRDGKDINKSTQTHNQDQDELEVK